MLLGDHSMCKDFQNILNTNDPIVLSTPLYFSNPSAMERLPDDSTLSFNLLEFPIRTDL